MDASGASRAVDGGQVVQQFDFLGNGLDERPNCVALGEKVVARVHHKQEHGLCVSYRTAFVAISFSFQMPIAARAGERLLKPCMCASGVYSHTGSLSIVPRIDTSDVHKLHVAEEPGGTKTVVDASGNFHRLLG